MYEFWDEEAKQFGESSLQEFLESLEKDDLVKVMLKASAPEGRARQK